MKKKLLLIPALLIALLLSACGSAPEKTLYEHGTELIALMNEMVQNDDYGKMLSASSELLDVAQKIAEGDYTSPSAVYKVTVPQDALSAMLGEDSGSAWENFSEGLQASLAKKSLASVVNQINAYSGVTYLAASSVYTASGSFVNTKADGDCMYLYVYANGYPAAVSFVTGENHAVYASGSFLLNDDFPTGSAEEIQEALASAYGDVGCTVEKVAI